MSDYRIVVNLEWTDHCNARCAMCPRDAINPTGFMAPRTLDAVLAQLSPADVFRTVIAGYGEPTLHPEFGALCERLRSHPVPFDMVSNGDRLDAERLSELDGAVRTLIVSFSSVVPEVYAGVHQGLDQERVMRNIRHAAETLQDTGLMIGLSPTQACLDSLPETLRWLRSLGIEALSMSPNLYDRAGTLDSLRAKDLESDTLLRTIEEHGLLSQELAFVPSREEVLQQCDANRFRCVPRNSTLSIGVGGQYHDCFNDPRRTRLLGDVTTMSVRDALKLRETLGPVDAVCDRCGLHGRYGEAELGVVLDRAEA